MTPTYGPRSLNPVNMMRRRRAARAAIEELQTFHRVQMTPAGIRIQGHAPDAQLAENWDRAIHYDRPGKAVEGLAVFYGVRIEDGQCRVMDTSYRGAARNVFEAWATLFDIFEINRPIS